MEEWEEKQTVRKDGKDMTSNTDEFCGNCECLEFRKYEPYNGYVNEYPFCISMNSILAGWGESKEGQVYRHGGCIVHKLKEKMGGIEGK